MTKEWWKTHEDEHLANELKAAGVSFSTITGDEMMRVANAVHAKYEIDQSPKVEIMSTNYPRNTIAQRENYVELAGAMFSKFFSGQQIYYFRRWRCEFNSLHAKTIFCLDGSDFSYLDFKYNQEWTLCLPDFSFVMVHHFSRFYQYAGEPGSFWDHADKTFQAMYDDSE